MSLDATPGERGIGRARPESARRARPSGPSGCRGPLASGAEPAVTTRHAGRGGIADELDTPEGPAAWPAERATPPDRRPLTAMWELRAAIRALLARAVRRGPPRHADAQRLLPAALALERLNAAAARVRPVPRPDRPEGGSRALDTLPVLPGNRPGAADLPTAAPARDAIAFPAGPERARPRACPAPRRVRHFVPDRPRQECCKPSCGNRRPRAPPPAAASPRERRAVTPQARPVAAVSRVPLPARRGRDGRGIVGGGVRQPRYG